MKYVLFLCTGNYYRSRFAEYFFNAEAEKRHLNWRAESRGLAVGRHSNNVGPISQHAVEALGRLDIALSRMEHFPLQAWEADFARADRIIALDESEHRVMIEESFPKWRHSVEYWIIHDLDRTAPEEAIGSLEKRILQLILELNS